MLSNWDNTSAGSRCSAAIFTLSEWPVSLESCCRIPSVCLTGLPPTVQMRSQRPWRRGTTPISLIVRVLYWRLLTKLIRKLLIEERYSITLTNIYKDLNYGKLLPATGIKCLYFVGYMELHASEKTAGLHIPMVTPTFEVRRNKCFLFHYYVWMSEFNRELRRSPELEVYISETSHVFSGWKVWRSNGTGEGLVQIPIWEKPGATYRISIVGMTNNPRTTLIKVANAKLDQGECYSLKCDNTLCADEKDISTTECELS